MGAFNLARESLLSRKIQVLEAAALQMADLIVDEDDVSDRLRDQFTRFTQEVFQERQALENGLKQILSCASELSRLRAPPSVRKYDWPPAMPLTSKRLLKPMPLGSATKRPPMKWPVLSACNRFASDTSDAYADILDRSGTPGEVAAMVGWVFADSP